MAAPLAMAIQSCHLQSVDGTECSSSVSGNDDLELGPGPWWAGLSVIVA